MTMRNIESGKTRTIAAVRAQDVSIALVLGVLASIGLWLDLVWVPLPKTIAANSTVRSMFSGASPHLALPLLYVTFGTLAVLVLRRHNQESSWPTWPESRVLCAMASLMLARCTLWATGDQVFYGLAVAGPTAFASYLIFRIRIVTAIDIEMEGLVAGTPLLAACSYALFVEPFAQSFLRSHGIHYGQGTIIPEWPLLFAFIPGSLTVPVLLVICANLGKKRKRFLLRRSSLLHSLLLFVAGTIEAYFLQLVFCLFGGHINPLTYIGEHGICVAIECGLWIFGFALVSSQLHPQMGWLWLAAASLLVFYNLTGTDYAIRLTGETLPGLFLLLSAVLLAFLIFKEQRPTRNASVTFKAQGGGRTHAN